MFNTLSKKDLLAALATQNAYVEKLESRLHKALKTLNEETVRHVEAEKNLKFLNDEYAETINSVVVENDGLKEAFAHTITKFGDCQVTLTNLQEEFDRLLEDYEELKKCSEAQDDLTWKLEDLLWAEKSTKEYWMNKYFETYSRDTYKED